MNELITSDQLAEELGVKPQTVRLWRTKTLRSSQWPKMDCHHLITLFGTTE